MWDKINLNFSFKCVDEENIWNSFKGVPVIA